MFVIANENGRKKEKQITVGDEELNKEFVD